MMLNLELYTYSNYRTYKKMHLEIYEDSCTQIPLLNNMWDQDTICTTTKSNGNKTQHNTSRMKTVGQAY